MQNPEPTPIRGNVLLEKKTRDLRAIWLRLEEVNTLLGQQLEELGRELAHLRRVRNGVSGASIPEGTPRPEERAHE